MKLDNFVNDKIKRISPNGNGKPSANEKIDFKELNGTSEEVAGDTSIAENE